MLRGAKLCKLRYYGDVIHSFNRKSAVEDDGGVLLHCTVLINTIKKTCSNNTLHTQKIRDCWTNSPIYRHFDSYLQCCFDFEAL